MKKIKNYLSSLNDKTCKLVKIDYFIMGVMILIYGIISFYHLGDLKAPNTYYTFEDNDSITINLGGEYDISKIMYFTGNNIGDISIFSSSDGNDYQYLSDIKTNSALAWEELYVNAKFSSLKFTGNSYKVTLGDMAFFDNNGNRINIASDKYNPLLDEIDLVPERNTYMNSTYFDEIYFSRCAYEYVNGIDCFEWSHPPLGKVLMSLPIYLFGYSPFNARLMSNLAGILLIPVMYILCKKIFKNRKYALLGACLMMFDNFHFAHTRIALAESYQLLFILSSVIFMKNYLDLSKSDSFKKKSINLILSGFFIGCAIATKWNALYVALGLAIIFFIHLAKQYDINVLKIIKKTIKNKEKINKIIGYLFTLILLPFSAYYLLFMLFGKNTAQILLTVYIVTIINFIIFKFILILHNDRYLLKLFLICILSFIIIPIAIYALSYLLFPNVSYYDGTIGGIVNQTKLMYDYHANLVATHPFTSKWYQWPIMYKPVWLYSSGSVDGMRMTIVDIGNPFIWWMGIPAFIYLVISAIKKNKTSLFILIFVLSALLPYIFIGRIMFIYHFFIVLPFIMLGIVSMIKWIIEKLKNDYIYYAYLGLVIITFFVFYPVVSGLNISEEYINALKWLSSWYF